MVLRVKGTSWAGVGWRPRDLTDSCKKFPVLADSLADLAGPQARALDLDATAGAEPEPAAAAAEPEPEAEPKPELSAGKENQAALESALESEGVGQQLPRNTRYRRYVRQVDSLVCKTVGVCEKQASSIGK